MNEESFVELQDAIYASIANTPCRDPMDAVMALCCVMCDLLVQINEDDDKNICSAVVNTLEIARQHYKSQEVH
jgi:hypothetical protein